mgnify:CR=1 FL=1
MTSEKPLTTQSADTSRKPDEKSSAPTSGELEWTRGWVRDMEEANRQHQTPMMECLLRAGRKTLEQMEEDYRRANPQS